MLGPRTVLVELRNGAGGIEGRVRRGRDGGWHEAPLLDWTELRFDETSDLIQRSETARIDPLSKDWGVDKIGRGLHHALGEVATVLQRLHRLGDVDRIVLATAPDTPGQLRRDLSRALQVSVAWRCLLDSTPHLWRALCWRGLGG